MREKVVPDNRYVTRYNCCSIDYYTAPTININNINLNRYTPHDLVPDTVAEVRPS